MREPDGGTAPLRLGAIVRLITFAAVLSGCSAKMSPQAMVPDSVSTSRKHSKPVATSVSGGQEEDPATGLPKISNEAFTEALDTAIRDSGVFPKVVPDNEATYLLIVNISALQQPLFGGSFTVTMTTGWQLKNLITDQLVWQQGVTTNHTVSMGEAFFGPTRLKLATEGAARENIRQGLHLISQLEL